MEEYDPADPTEDAGGGGDKKKEEKVPETKPDIPPGKSESSEKTEISMADFPTQFGKPKKKSESYFHEGMSDLPSRYDKDDDERGYRRRRRDWGDGNVSDEEERFEREYDDLDRHRFGRGRGRGGRFGRPPRHFDDEDDDEFGRDGPPRFEDNPFRRLEKGDRRPPYEMDDRRLPPRDRYEDRPPFDDDRYGPPGPPRFRRGSPPPFDDDRRRRFRRDGPPFDGPPPFDRPPFDDDRYDRPPRFGPGPSRYDHDMPPRYDRDGPPPFDEDRPPYDRYHYHRDGPPPFGPPRPDSPPFGQRHGPPPPRPRGGLLPTPPPSVQQQPEQQYSGPPPGPPEGHHQGAPFPSDGGPRFGPPQQPGPPPPMGPPPFQQAQPYQGQPSFPAPPQQMMPGPPPGMPPQMPQEMPPMSTSMEGQQYFPPPPPPMMQQVDPMMQQQMYGQMPLGQMPPGQMAGLPPPPPPQFNMQHQQPPPPPPMEQPMMPQMPPPPVDQHQHQLMQQFPPQPPMPHPQQPFEPMPPPQVMAFPPPPPPPPADSPSMLPVPEQIPIPPPPSEEEHKSEDMEIEAAEVPDVPAEQPVAEETFKSVFSAAPTFSQPSEVYNQAVTTSMEPSAVPTEPVSVSAQPASPFLQAPPAFSQQNDVVHPQPPPPTVVFPTQIYSAPPQIQVQEEAKTAAQKAAQELLQLTNHMAQTVQAEKPVPQLEPEPEPAELEPKGFQPVDTEVVQEPILNPEPELKQYPMVTQEREATPEKQPTGDPIKTTAQQLLERIKQKQLKAQASSAQVGGSNPLLKSTRRFFNPVAMVAGSKIQFAMASAKKNVTTDNPLKAQEEDAEKKKKKEGKKEMFRPGLDGEETLSSIMQKYQQHQKLIEHLKTSKDGDSETVEMTVDSVPSNENSEYTKVPNVEEKDIVEKPKEEPVQDEALENKTENKKRSRFADMTEEEIEFVREKEQEAMTTVGEETKPRESSPARKKEDDKSHKSKRSPSPEHQEESKSKYRRRTPSPRQRSKTPDRGRERRDRRSRSRSYEDRYSYDDRYNRKSRRSPSPRRRDYDDRRRGPTQRYRDDDFQRGYRDGRGYRGWRQQDRSPSPRNDYRSRQRDRSASPRSKNYRGQRSPSPRSNYRSRPKERSPSPKQKREYSESPDEYKSRGKSPELDYTEKNREDPSKDKEFKSSKQRDVSPPPRVSEKTSRARDRTPEYSGRSRKQSERSPSPQQNDYRSSKQQSQSPRQTDFRKQKERSPSFKSSDYRSRQGQDPSSEENRLKPRERSQSPRSSEYNQKRRQRSPSPKATENKPQHRETSPSFRAKVSVEKQKTGGNVDARRGGQAKRKESASSSSSSSESSSSEESDSDKSSDTPEDERIKKEKREKLLMELKSIEESLEKQRTLKKKGKGKDFGKMEDRERSEDRQSQKSGRSEEGKKAEHRWDSRQKRDEERPQPPPEQKIKEVQERDFDDRQQQDIPDFYLKSVEKYQKEYKSKRNEYDDQSRKTKRDDFDQPYGPEERWERDRRESRMEYDENTERERRSAGKRSSGDERNRGEYDDRRYYEQASDPQASYGENKRGEKVDSRKRFEKRKQDQKYEKSESSDEEMEQDNTRDRRRDSRTRYSDRDDTVDPRYNYDDVKNEQRYEDKRKTGRPESRRGFSERNPDYDGNYTEKRRESYSDYTDASERSYNDRRQDVRSQEKPRSRDDYDEVERKREYQSPPVEESPRKRERVEYPSKQSEYESYEGYHPGGRSTSEKSNKIDPVEELDYYLNRKPKPAQPTQPEKNGKWHTEKSVSPPDIRQSYYSPKRIDSDEEEQYEKKSKKKKKHRSRSPISRDSKKKSKRSKRSPSQDSDDQNRHRRSFRSPVMEELERDSRRRSPSPRYRRSPSPEDQPYHSRAERYWRPPDHKLDEIHHYTDKKHKSASIVQDFPQLLEIEQSVRKAGDKESKDEKDKTIIGQQQTQSEVKATEPDPTKKQEPDDPPMSLKTNDAEDSSNGGAAASHKLQHDQTKEETPKQIRRRPKIKRLPVPGSTSPHSSLNEDLQSTRSSQSDSQSEANVSDGEKSSVSQTPMEKEPTKILEEPNLSTSEICQKEEDKSSLASLMSVYEDSDNESPHKKLHQDSCKMDQPNESSETAKNESEVIKCPVISSSVDISYENNNAETDDTPRLVGKTDDTPGSVGKTDDTPGLVGKEQRKSIIADYSDSDDNTNQSGIEQSLPQQSETNTSQNLADEVFRNIMSKMGVTYESSSPSRNVESTPVTKIEDEVVKLDPSPVEQIVPSTSKLENIANETDTQTDTNTGTKTNVLTKSELSNDAIKLQYKRTRYGVRVKSKESEKINEERNNSSSEVEPPDRIGDISSITIHQKGEILQENKAENQLKLTAQQILVSESTCSSENEEQIVQSQGEITATSQNLGNTTDDIVVDKTMGKETHLSSKHSEPSEKPPEKWMSPRAQNKSQETFESKQSDYHQRSQERKSESPELKDSKIYDDYRHSPKRLSRSPEMVKSRKSDKSLHLSERHSRSPEMVKSRKSTRSQSPEILKSKKFTRSHSSERRSRSPEIGKSRKHQSRHSPGRHSRSPEIVKSQKSTRSHSPERRSRSPEIFRNRKSDKCCQSPERSSRSPEMVKGRKSTRSQSPERHSRSPEMFRSRKYKSQHSPERYSKSPEVLKSRKSTRSQSPERRSRSPEMFRSRKYKSQHSPERYSKSPEMVKSRKSTRSQSPERHSRSPEMFRSRKYKSQHSPERKKSTRGHSPERYSKSPEIVKSRKSDKSRPERYSISPEMVKSRKSTRSQSPERSDRSPEMVKSRKFTRSQSPERSDRSPEMVKSRKSTKSHSLERYNRSPEMVKSRKSTKSHSPERRDNLPTDESYRYTRFSPDMHEKHRYSPHRFSPQEPKTSQSVKVKDHTEVYTKPVAEEEIIELSKDSKENSEDQISVSSLQVLEPKLTDDTDYKLTERGGKGQTRKSTVDEMKPGSSRWSLRSRGSEESLQSVERTSELRDESPKPVSRSKRSRKSEDDNLKEAHGEEQQAARRRTRSSRSTEGFVDQKTPDIPIERQLSKRQKKSRKNKNGDEKLELALERDPKLSSQISVDLSSIALPGEGIRIKIFSESLSPTSEKSLKEHKTCHVKLEEIVLPGELSKKTNPEENLTSEVTTVTKKDEKETKPEVTQEKQTPVEPPRKEYPIRSQKLDTNPPSHPRPSFTFTSKKLPDDRRQPIKFGLPKSSTASKRWEDDEEDMDFTDKLTKKSTDDELESIESQNVPTKTEDVTSNATEAEQPVKDEETTPKKMEKSDVAVVDKSHEQFSSDDDPEISFKTPSLVKTLKVVKPVEPVVESQQPTVTANVTETSLLKELPDVESKSLGRKKKLKGRNKSRWDPPEPVRSDDLYDPTIPTDDEVKTSPLATDDEVKPSSSATDDEVKPLALTTDDEVKSSASATDDQLKPLAIASDDEVKPSALATEGKVRASALPTEGNKESAELYDPMQPTDVDEDDTSQNQQGVSVIQKEESLSSLKMQQTDYLLEEKAEKIDANLMNRSQDVVLQQSEDSLAGKHYEIKENDENAGESATPSTVTKSNVETVAIETELSTNEALSEKKNESEKIQNQQEACRTESIDDNTSMMIEIAPEHADDNIDSKASLLTSKQLQMPIAESSPRKKETEEGEILSEADDKKEKEKSVGMAIETVVSDKKSHPAEEVVKVKEEHEGVETPGQVIQSIVTSRAKPVVEHVVKVSKVIAEGEEQSPHKMKSMESMDTLKKAQTEEALRLLEQFKGIDTKNEEAIKMIEKFRSVDKELKTLDLDKPRSKKETWEKDSYKDRYEDSRYRDHGKYKEKDYDRYSKDRDYDRYEDRSKSYGRRREKIWDRKRRGSQDRYDSRDRHDKKRYKKDRYSDRRERSYSRDRSHSRSPDRVRHRSRDHSRSRSRDRSKERSRRRSRDSRSRSRERSRKSKRSRQERSRYSSSESDDSRSSRKEREPYLDSSKGEVDKLTEEWIRMATEKPKKSKTPTTTTATISSPVVSAVTSTSTASPHLTTTPAYYQDTYGNYYPVTSTSQTYQSYSSMPPTPGQPQVMPPPNQSVPGMVPSSQTMPQHQMIPSQGMPPHQQGLPQQHTMPPPVIQPSLQHVPQNVAQPGFSVAPHNQAMPPQNPVMPPQGQVMPPQSQMMPPDSIQMQNQPVPPYHQTGIPAYNQQSFYGQPTQDPMYRTDQHMYGHQPQQVPSGQQMPPGQPPGGLLPTPVQGIQEPVVNQQQKMLPWQQLPIQSPLISEKPEIVLTESSTKTNSLQGTRLPFPMPTQQTVPLFKPSELKPAVAQQNKPMVSPQEASQSPVIGQDSRASTSSPAIVTSSSKEYQLPELPYQQQGEATLPLRSDVPPAEAQADVTAYSKPVDVKPITKPLLAMKGFKIKQKGLSLVMPTDDVVSSSFQSDAEEKSKKIDTPDVNVPPVVSDLPKHPPPSSQTGLPIKLGMKQDKRDIDLASPPPSASPRPEKVKSRWRRLSDFETPVAQSPDSNLTEGTLTASSASEGEQSPTKEPEQAKLKEATVYDAWDPASDIIITPEAMKTQPAIKAFKKESTASIKREKKEKLKESDSPLKVDSPLKTEKVKEPEPDPNKPPYFEPLDENLYLSERKKSKKMKRMLCDCVVTEEEKKANVPACGEDCLNRMLYIECGNRCQCGEYCTNKRFQRREYSDVEPFRTDWKGFGLKTNAELPQGQFVMEYVGEVLDYKTFKSRTKQYAKSGESHFYFMALNADEVIDASYKGNISRFINHSCDPNCETQKRPRNG